MKTRFLKFAAGLLPAFAMVLTATSCDKDDDINYVDYRANAIVTVKPSSDGKAFTMQLDDNTTLKASNLTASPFGNKEVRALLSASTVDKNAGIVFVNWMDSIRTKPAVRTEGSAEKDIAKYGNDPVEIVDGWQTVVEDGYLTLRFRTRWGESLKPHMVNLVTGCNPNDPYEVVFRHDAAGDTSVGRIGDGLVAFRLSDLPDTEGKYVDLTLRWNSFSGEKTVKFKYRTRK